MTLSELPKPVDLSPYAPISGGRHRAIYDLPDCPGMLFKVTKAGAEAPALTLSKRITRALAPRSVDRAIYIETQAYLRVLLRKPDVLDEILPRFYGAVTTSLGPATVHEKLVSETGALAPTLNNLMEDGTLDEKHVAQLNKFCDTLRERHVVVNDLSPHNIAFSGGRFYLVDGLGDRNLVRIRSWFSEMNARSQARKCRAMAEGSPRLDWDEGARRFRWRDA